MAQISSQLKKYYDVNGKEQIRREFPTDLCAVEEINVPFGFLNLTGDFTVYRNNGIANFSFQIGDGNQFSDFSGSETIAVLPKGYRPVRQQAITCQIRNGGAWATASYEPVCLRISTNGNVVVSGNATTCKTYRYLTLCACYIANVRED